MKTIHRRAVVVVIVIASILSISIAISDSGQPFAAESAHAAVGQAAASAHPVGRVSRIRPAWLKGMLRSPNGNGAFWTCGASTVSASGHWHTSATISKRMAWLRLQAEARSSGTAVLSQIGKHPLAP